MRRALVGAALVVAAAAALLGTARPARADVIVGIGDQKPEMFTDPRFVALGIRNARLQVGWDAMGSPWQVAELDAWLGAARKAGVTPLVTFGHSRTVRRSLPSPSRFKYEFRRFRARYPWVTRFVTWNEANHCGEPTCHRPRLVGAYWSALQHECPTCTILAAELLDEPNMASWARTFVRYVGRQPERWGLHSYVDANRFRTTGTKRLLHAVRGDIWMTEVGGIVWRRNRPATGKNQIRLRESPSHAANATRWLFDRLVPLSPRIRRVYIYQWNASSIRDTWDSGLITPGGRPRPALRVLEDRVLDGVLLRQPL